MTTGRVTPVKSFVFDSGRPHVETADERGARAFEEYVHRLLVTSTLIRTMRPVADWLSLFREEDLCPIILAFIHAYKAYTDLEEKYDTGHRRPTTEQT